MDIIITTIPVEAHWLISAIKWYYAILHYSYKIIKEELLNISTEAALQIAIKAVNDTAGLDSLMLIFLVFSAYL